MSGGAGADREAAIAAVLGDAPAVLTLHDAVVRAVRDACAPDEPETRPGTGQIAFRRAHPFAAVWRPDRYLHGETAPLVLTVFARERLDSPRWKEVVEPAPGRFTHHLELRDPADVDDEVCDWLRRAWAAAA